MFGKVKDYAVKKLLEKQLKGVPEDQKEMILAMVEKDPKLFEKIAKELQTEMKTNGNNQMNASMKVPERNHGMHESRNERKDGKATDGNTRSV